MFEERQEEPKLVTEPGHEGNKKKVPGENEGSLKAFEALGQ